LSRRNSSDALDRQNNKQRIRFYKAACLLTSLFLIGVLSLAQKPALPKTKTVSLKGRPLAGVDYLTGFLRGGLGDRYEVFVFGVDPSNRGSSIAPVKVMYRFFQSESALPDSFFDASKRYELEVVRAPDCDETVQSLSYQKNTDDTGKPLASTYILRPLTGTPQNVLKPDLMLPCYVLRPGRYKMLE